MVCTGVVVDSIRWRHVERTKKCIDRRSGRCQQGHAGCVSGAASQWAVDMGRQRCSKQSGVRGSSQALDDGGLGAGRGALTLGASASARACEVRVGAGCRLDQDDAGWIDACYGAGGRLRMVLGVVLVAVLQGRRECSVPSRGRTAWFFPWAGQ